jgi:FecR protein
MKRLTHFLGGSGIKILGLSLLAGSLVGTSVSVVAGGASRSDRARQQSQERYLEITEIQGTVTYETGSLKAEGRPAKVGDRLRASGEGISTGSSSRAKLAADSGIGIIDVSENTNLQVKNLSTLPNGAKNTQLAMNRGQNRVRVRSFTNPQSRFSIQTPTGVAGVRGTDFTVIVRPNGETRVLTVQGMVEVAAQNQTQRLSAGSYSVIAPGKSPTPPGSISGNLRLSLEVLPAPDEGKVRVSGTVNPIHSVLLNNQALEPSPTGQFDTVATIGPDRRLILVVRSPLGEEQVYELAVP